MLIIMTRARALFVNRLARRTEVTLIQPSNKFHALEMTSTVTVRIPESCFNFEWEVVRNCLNDDNNNNNNNIRIGLVIIKNRSDEGYQMKNK